MDEGKGQLNVRHQPESRNGIRMKQTMRKRTKPGERKEKRGEGEGHKSRPLSMAGGSAGVGDPVSLGHWAADHLNE